MKLRKYGKDNKLKHTFPSLGRFKGVRGKIAIPPRFAYFCAKSRPPEANHIFAQKYTDAARRYFRTARRSAV